MNDCGLRRRLASCCCVRPARCLALARAAKKLGVLIRDVTATPDEGTSSPEDKLAGDLGNVIGATSIGGRRSDFFTCRKLAPGNLGLLQQYPHVREVLTRAANVG